MMAQTTLSVIKGSFLKAQFQTYAAFS